MGYWEVKDLEALQNLNNFFSVKHFPDFQYGYPSFVKQFKQPVYFSYGYTWINLFGP